MTDPHTTRGAQKLIAAIAAFELAPKIAGARAIDVGASTGGFSATLLASGAAEVTVIDAGREQLAASLRTDPRVHWHEQTDFRRAPLALAPGPFDFFTVDVSFMAARNVLRSLAFRLRPGAEGIVLLKPQFELPGSLVRDGDVSEPKLRARALERFRQRAHALGFRVERHHDSIVAGGSGTVEMLLHLYFERRPSQLPQPGEKRGASETKARAGREGGEFRTRNQHASSAALEWFAVSAPGLESILAQELRTLPQLLDVTQVPGGSAFRGPLAAGYDANLRSRIATRVLVRVGAVEAREFAPLRRRLAQLPFERFLTPQRELRIDASARGCRLYHTGALRETLLHAVSDRLGAQLVLRSGVDPEGAADAGLPFGREAFARVLIRGEGDRFDLSVDSSGVLLHKRGARVETGRAPLRETLASGLLRLAGYSGTQPLVNAMCGAGTIALEAASIALERAPGHARGFAFEGFPGFDPNGLAAAREQAQRSERAELPATIHAFDRDARALELARRNLERADAARLVQLSCADIREFTPPAAQGLFVANPPYGHRLGHGREVAELYRTLGEQLRRCWQGWRAALLVPRAAPSAALGLERARSFPLTNGGLRVQLLVIDL